MIGGPSSLSAEIARSVLAGFGSQVAAVQVAVGTALAAAGAAPDPALARELAAAAIAAPAPIVLAAGETADRTASSKTYYGASMAVLFVFFAAQFGVLSLLAERRNGTLARMLAAPIAPATILLGKVLVSLVVAVVSMTVIVAGHDAPAGRRLGRPAGGRRPGLRGRARGHAASPRSSSGSPGPRSRRPASSPSWP